MKRENREKTQMRLNDFQTRLSFFYPLFIRKVTYVVLAAWLCWRVISSHPWVVPHTRSARHANCRSFHGRSRVTCSTEAGYYLSRWRVFIIYNQNAFKGKWRRTFQLRKGRMWFCFLRNIFVGEAMVLRRCETCNTVWSHRAMELAVLLSTTSKRVVIVLSSFHCNFHCDSRGTLSFTVDVSNSATFISGIMSISSLAR